MKKLLAVAVVAAMAVSAVFAQGGQDAGATAAGADLIINNGAEPQSLDPSLIQGVPEHRIYEALFEGLVTYDPKTAYAAPGVAESWTISPDGLTLTFKLRKTTWSDGTPITAQTFVDSWLRTLDPATASNYAYMVGMIVKGAAAYNEGTGPREGVAIKALDDYTFQVELTGPAPYAVDMMAHYSFAPIPLQTVAKFGADWTKPANFVGNGPFVLSQWNPQEKIVVTPNAKYWDAKNVFLKSVTFLPIEDNNTAYQKYKAGEIDWSTGIPLALLDEVKLRSDYQLSPQLATYYYIFNVTKKPVDDVRVRKALTMALNLTELVEKVTKGGQVVATSISPAMPGYTPAKGNAYNVEAAKKLLAEAGYPNGQGFPKITVIYNTNDNHKKIAEWVQQTWKKNLGIDVELQNIEWKTFLDVRSKQHDFVITRAGWVGDYQDPNTFLDMFIKGSGNNDGLYDNPAYDALVAKAAKTPAGAERFKLLSQAEDILITKDQAVAPFYFYVSQNLIDLSKWEGWYNNPLDVHPYKGLKKIK